MLKEALETYKSGDDFITWYNELSPDEKAILECEFIAFKKQLIELWQVIQDLYAASLEIFIDFWRETNDKLK